MAAAVPLRTDYDAARLRALARFAVDPGQVRRLLALAAIYAGEARSGAAAIGGVGLQTVRDWVVRFNADGPEGLATGKAPGKQSLLDARQRSALFEIVVAGPNPAVDGVVRWRIVDLIQWVWEEFRLSISKQTMSRELRAMGLRKLSARPRHHAQDKDAADAFKKTSSRSWRRSRRARPQASP
jgi:transposase